MHTYLSHAVLDQCPGNKKPVTAVKVGSHDAYISQPSCSGSVSRIAKVGYSSERS